MSDDDSNTFQRLGKRELGRHAFEERMPNRIAKLIAEEDDQNTHTGIIPNLASMLSRDSNVEVAHLCTEHAIQIHKLPNEGAHFCGYRNMQTLCLALGHSEWQAAAEVDLRKKLSIPELQDLIEQAWDQGINAHGRIEIGDIKGTRKHVGTSEVEALLLSFNIPCIGSHFEGKEASSELLDAVENYFASTDSQIRTQGRVKQTSRPPIFLQRPRHSVTIAGLTKFTSGKRRILIFDPAWRPPAAMFGTPAQDKKLSWNEVLALRRYSKSERYLRRFSSFEILKVHRQPD